MSASSASEEMEEITDSDSSGKNKDLIRLRFGRNDELCVTRSLLIKSSSYFAAMLSKDSVWEESSNEVIELSGWNQKYLRTIIDCLESEKPDSILRDVDRYFGAINYFSMSNLAEQCIEYKIANISNESVLNDLKFAEHYSISALKESCTHRLLNNLPEILADSTSNLKMPLDLMKKLLSHNKLSARNEDDVLSMIDLWSWSRTRKNVDRKELLRCLRFAHLTESAFEKCRKDAQCLEIPEFRALVESSRWSDLDENVLSGRSSAPLHVHTLGFLQHPHVALREKAPPGVEDREVLLYCSARGLQKPMPNFFSEVYVEALLHQGSSVEFGNKLFCFRNRLHDFEVPGGLAPPVETMQLFPDTRDPSPTLFSIYPDTIFPVAPPAILGGDLCVAHLVHTGQVARYTGNRNLFFENFGELEILRYRDGQVKSKRLRVNIESVPWQKLSRSLPRPESNTLRVRDGWMFLLVAKSGLLLSIDEQPAIRSVTEIPSEHWAVQSETRRIYDTRTDLAIVGNVAFVLFKFTLCKHLPGNGSPGRIIVYGTEAVGSIIACDLIEGKPFPGQALDLNSLFAEEERSRRGLKYEAFLRVFQNKVFLILISNIVEERGEDIPIPRHHVYRIERSPEKLSLTLIGEDDKAQESKITDHRWEGIPVNLDAHPCERATMLQLKAHQEKDPIRREKLRRFIY